MSSLQNILSLSSTPFYRVNTTNYFSTIVCLTLFLVTSISNAQEERVTGFQNRTFAIQNAKLVISPNKSIENGTLVVRHGIITAVGQKIIVPKDAEIIDGHQMIVYPGFIDAGATSLIDTNKKPKSTAGRKPNFSRYVLAATRPDNRKSLTPEFQIHNALNLDRKQLDSFRKSGITAIHIIPYGRVASGQGTFISAGQSPLRESTLRSNTVSQLQLFGPGNKGYPTTLMGATSHLRQAFLDTQRHALHSQLFQTGAKNIERPPVDETWQALEKLLSHKQSPVFTANSRDDIHRALSFSKEFNLSPIIWGGREAYRCIISLKKKALPVILQLDFGEEPKIENQKKNEKLSTDFKHPIRYQKDQLGQWKARIAGISELRKAGIPLAFSSHGLKKPEDLLAQVQTAVKQGLSRNVALSALTTDAAKILGMQDRMGTLEVGKLAHLVVMTGPFDDSNSKVRYVLIDSQKFEYNKNLKPNSKNNSRDDHPVAAMKPSLLSGTWSVQIVTDKEKKTASLKLKQSGKKLTGSFNSPQGNGELQNGSFTENQLKFTVQFGSGKNSLKLSFKAKLENDKLAGTLASAFGSITNWTATKSKLSKAALVQNSTQESPAEAQKPGNAIIENELPTELESDRLNRPILTGGNLLLQNATVITGTGKTLPNTSILIQDGKFAAIGKNIVAPAGTTVIDTSGRFIMPGIIDTHSHIMISQGVNEATQSIVPEVRIRDAINTADVSEYRAIAGGTTTARLFHGSANVIGGQDAVVKFKFGSTRDEHLVPNSPQGVKFALGENVKYRRDRFPNTRLGVEATLNRAFLEAIDYRRAWQKYEQQLASSNGTTAKTLFPPRRDLRLEALADIVNHEKFIHSHCYRADEILMLLNVTSNLGIRVWSLQHVLEGYKVAPEIVAHGASCSTFADWWAYKVEAFDATPYNAALLQEAGANVVIKSDDRELIRHLNVEAAKTVRYGGMTPEQAIATITINPARELGLDKRLGSIEVGKEADLAIYNGHPLNAFSRCEMTVIDGEIVFIRERQPSAMSAAAAIASATPPTLTFQPQNLVHKKLTLPETASGTTAIVGATLHPVSAEKIENGTLLIRDGKITAMGKQIALHQDIKIVNARGLHVYPGMIDAGTTLGLVEINKVSETHDYSESGNYHPDLRAGIAINPDSELLPVARAGGITTILVRPTGGIIAGQSSLVKLEGWTAPEMVTNYEAGLQINWPTGGDAKKRIDELKDFLKEARLYLKLRKQSAENNQTGPITDPRYESLKPYLNRTKPTFIEANNRKQIAEALLFAEEENLKMILTGGGDAWKLASELKARNIPVIIGPVLRSPVESYDPFDAPYANPGRLYAAGVKFCIRSQRAYNSRNAPFEAAMAVAYGLPEAEALKAVTLSAAQILGVDNNIGSLAVGKQATLIITDGSPLQQTTHIKGIFINGKPFAPESRQTRFYERYRKRLQEVRAKEAKSSVPSGQ